MVDTAKKDRAGDSKKVVPSYEAEAAALRARTERLRALRLAKEAAEPKPVAAAAPVRKATKAKAGKAAPKASGTLSDWMKAQRESGRNT